MPGQFFAWLAALPVTFALGPLPVRAPVAAVAASDGGAAALTEAAVRVMDGAGFPVGQLAAPGPATSPLARRRARPAGGFATAAGVLDDDDFNDPYDADSAIEDPENILPGDEAGVRRPVRAPTQAGGVSLAADGATAWAARADGLWRLPFTGGAQRVTLPASGPVRRVAASADGRVIVAALDHVLLRSEDGGARFEELAGAPARPSALAVTDDGQAYALADDGVWRLGGPGGGRLLLRQVEDVTACGNDVLALVNRRLVVLGDASPSPPPAQDLVDPGPFLPPGAERVACAPAGAVWVAYGVALWSSEDRGRSWRARDEVDGTFSIAAVAATHSALWVASAAGLAVLPLRPAAEVVAPPSAWLPSSADHGSGDRPARRRWWLCALPRIDLDFATARSTTRRDVRAFVLLSFTFDPGGQTGAERRAAADARAEERRHAARQAQLRGAAGEGAADAVAIEEREATSRLLD